MNFKTQVDFEVYFQLLAKLIMESRDLVDKARHYLDNPLQFLEDYEDYCSFEEEDIEDLGDDPDFKYRHLPSDVMTGLLAAEGYIWRVDWRESPAGISYAVNRLLERRGLPGLDKARTESETKGISANDFLNKVRDELGNRGLQLAYIDDGSDSFPLIIVPAGDFKEISDLAGSLGVEIKTVFR